jgi:hypothetical protein
VQWRRFQRRVWRRTLTVSTTIDTVTETKSTALPEAAPTLSVEVVLEEGASGPGGPIETRRIG